MRSLLRGFTSPSHLFNCDQNLIKSMFTFLHFSCRSFSTFGLSRTESKLTQTPAQIQRKTFEFLHSDSPLEHSSVRLLSVNKAFSNSAPKSIIKSGCRQGRRGEPKWGRETNGAPRCRLGCRRWGCKRDLMVGWIREILVTMLNNYGSSRDQSAIDWTPQAFSTHSLGKQRLVN